MEMNYPFYVNKMLIIEYIYIYIFDVKTKVTYKPRVGWVYLYFVNKI